MGRLIKRSTGGHQTADEPTYGLISIELPYRPGKDGVPQEKLTWKTEGTGVIAAGSEDYKFYPFF